MKIEPTLFLPGPDGDLGAVLGSGAGEGEGRSFKLNGLAASFPSASDTMDLDFGFLYESGQSDVEFSAPGVCKMRMETYSLESGFIFYLNEIVSHRPLAFNCLRLPESRGFGFCMRGDMRLDGGEYGGAKVIRPGEMAVFCSPGYGSYVEKLPAARLFRVSISHCQSLERTQGGPSSPGLEGLFRDTGLFADDRNFVDSFVWPESVGRILREIVSCSYFGPLRRIYMEAKALELFALSIQIVSPGETRGRTHGSLSRRDVEKAREAASFLVRDFEAVPSLDELARSVGLSRSKLIHIFKLVHGTSPFAYLKDHRLVKAREMLEDNRINVTEAAMSVGYSSLSHFTKAFTRRFNFHPSDCRRNKM
ncbi:MAG: AraC family transcriptional regulator [Deltaproteobacteria bacterium]|jgi:AraC-like DNA-binding protein|nr:AraC family transcriptional regulator [Deltaproteobacteria bacterium]